MKYTTIPVYSRTLFRWVLNRCYGFYARSCLNFYMEHAYMQFWGSGNNTYYKVFIYNSRKDKYDNDDYFVCSHVGNYNYFAKDRLKYAQARQRKRRKNETLNCESRES